MKHNRGEVKTSGGWVVGSTEVTFSSPCFCCCFCVSLSFFPSSFSHVFPSNNTSSCPKHHVKNFKRQDQNNLHHAGNYRRWQMSHIVTATFFIKVRLVSDRPQQGPASRFCDMKQPVMFWKALCHRLAPLHMLCWLLCPQCTKCSKNITPWSLFCSHMAEAPQADSKQLSLPELSHVLLLALLWWVTLPWESRFFFFFLLHKQN